MKILVDLDCRDPQLCGDCNMRVPAHSGAWFHCEAFRKHLYQYEDILSNTCRLDECKAASAQISLAAKLLDLAACNFSNRVCSDFDLIEDGDLTVEEAREIQKMVEARRHPSEQGEADLDSPHGDEWIFMQTLASAFEGK